eukprot:5116949-Pleurochrysis_carterae.AAC.1
MDHKHTTDLNFQQSWLYQERNRMQQPSVTIANLDGPRTDDRRVPQHRGQASQPHRPAWWTPGGGRGNGPPSGGNRS